MAYYNSSYYGQDYGEFYPSKLCYNTYYDTPVEDHRSYLDYNFNKHQIANDHHQTPLFSDCHPVSTYSRIAYSVWTSCEPKYTEGEWLPDYPQENRFVVSYSVSEFGEPGFDEYDPTPYGGGYDPVRTYGKPLPPSDEICYPRSTLDQPALPTNGLDLGSVIAPLGEEKAYEKVVEQPETDREISNSNDGDNQQKTLEKYQGEMGEENHVNDLYPFSGYRKREYEKQVNHEIPSGYGLEAMDICESLFGYCPCLSSYERRGSYYDTGDCGNPWKGTADYLFGSSNPYEERKFDDVNTDYYGNAIYSNSKNYQEHPLYHHQVEYVEHDSWF